jgi:hypothetical protein
MHAEPVHADARRLARHLIGEEPTPEEASRWVEAVRIRGAALTTPRDRRLWAIAMQHPWLLGPADAGLAFVDPYSPVRHRILLMLAILEASPAHHRHFLAAPWPRIALLGLGLRAALAALRAAAGIVWVRSHGILWR